MKMMLRIVAADVDNIRRALKELSERSLHGSCCGTVDGASYDYDFVDSSDLYAEDRYTPVLPLHDFPKTKES